MAAATIPAKPVQPPLPAKPARQSLADLFVDRFYRLTTLKGNNVSQIFITLDEPTKVHQMVPYCKRMCDQDNIRFLGVEPAFVHIPSIKGGNDRPNEISEIVDE